MSSGTADIQFASQKYGLKFAFCAKSAWRLHQVIFSKVRFTWRDYSAFENILLHIFAYFFFLMELRIVFAFDCR